MNLLFRLTKILHSVLIICIVFLSNQLYATVLTPITKEKALILASDAIAIGRVLPESTNNLRDKEGNPTMLKQKIEIERVLFNWILPTIESCDSNSSKIIECYVNPTREHSLKPATKYLLFIQRDSQLNDICTLIDFFDITNKTENEIYEKYGDIWKFKQLILKIQEQQNTYIKTNIELWKLFDSNLIKNNHKRKNGKIIGNYFLKLKNYNGINHFLNSDVIIMNSKFNSEYFSAFGVPNKARSQYSRLSDLVLYSLQYKFQDPGININAYHGYYSKNRASNSWMYFLYQNDLISRVSNPDY